MNSISNFRLYVTLNEEPIHLKEEIYFSAEWIADFLEITKNTIQSQRSKLGIGVKLNTSAIYTQTDVVSLIKRRGTRKGYSNQASTLMKFIRFYINELLRDFRNFGELQEVLKYITAEEIDLMFEEETIMVKSFIDRLNFLPLKEGENEN